MSNLSLYLILCSDSSSSIIGGVAVHNAYLKLHVLLSMLSLLVLMFAGLLALLLALQERTLRNKSLFTWARKLPPLETMESYLFLLNGVGFVLLTAVLCTSFYFYHALLWRHTILLPKTLLTVTAWLVFLILLLGRHWRGWRGGQAINSTLSGVILLIIVYMASLPF
jgi:ABC-type uncharacterized transport system permease subunit